MTILSWKYSLSYLWCGLHRAIYLSKFTKLCIVAKLYLIRGVFCLFVYLFIYLFCFRCKWKGSREFIMTESSFPFFFYWNIVDLQYVFVSPGATVVKNPSASAGDRRNVGLSLGEEDSLE